MEQLLFFFALFFWPVVAVLLSVSRGSDILWTTAGRVLGDRCGIRLVRILKEKDLGHVVGGGLFSLFLIDIRFYGRLLFLQ